MKNKTITEIFITILFLLMITTVSGQQQYLGTFKTNEPVNLIQTCANCTFVNITSILRPDSVLIVSDVAMTKDNFRYNYTMAAQTQHGTYQACGIGDLDGVFTVWCYDFDLTSSGEPINMNVFYFFMIILSLLMVWSFVTDNFILELFVGILFIFMALIMFLGYFTNFSFGINVGLSILFALLGIYLLYSGILAIVDEYVKRKRGKQVIV